MITGEPFEDELSKLKEKHEDGFFEYNGPPTIFTTKVTEHFRDMSWKKERYGIYIVRQKNTQEILYIGKGGTIDSEGRFKGQDIPGRLKNVKDSNRRANDWFCDLFKEKGALRVEYIFLPISESPAFVEAALLQVYLNEHHYLPYKNKSF